MLKPIPKSMLCLLAAASMTCAPLAFAGHHGWRGGHHGYRHGYSHRHYRGHYAHHRGYRHYRHPYHRNHFGRWVAGAIVLGALTDIAVHASQPRTRYYREPSTVYDREPRVVERRTVVYDRAPVRVRRVYDGRVVYTEPHRTQYLRDEGYDGD